MSQIRSGNTAPERSVRRELHAAGFRFRLHVRDLPGRPDVVLPKYRTAIMVHGCFWHGHDCPRGRRPTANAEFWARKIERNMERDAAAVAALEASGWTVLTIWTCRLHIGTSDVIERLKASRAANR
ncbi:very short patch repair endonuclease [Mesorhizobium sp. M1169]